MRRVAHARTDVNAQFVLGGDAMHPALAPGDDRPALAPGDDRPAWASSLYWNARRLQPKARPSQAREVCRAQARSVLRDIRLADSRRVCKILGESSPGEPAPAAVAVPAWALELRREAETAARAKEADQKMKQKIAHDAQQREYDAWRKRREAQRVDDMFKRVDRGGQLLKRVNEQCADVAKDRERREARERERLKRQHATELHERVLRDVQAHAGRQLAARAVTTVEVQQWRVMGERQILR